MTSQGSAHGRFTRAIQQRNLWAAEMALRELGQPALEDALAYLDLLAEQKPEKLERAAVRWHGRLETETAHLTLAESQLALAALASLCAGERDAVQVLTPIVAARAADACASSRGGLAERHCAAPHGPGSRRRHAASSSATTGRKNDPTASAGAPSRHNTLIQPLRG
jgi:hypothetical protein